MTYKLDLFEILGKIDSGDFNYWNQLTEEQRKGFAPLIIQRWMSGTSDERQIIALNLFSNKNIFSIANDPELLYKTLVACSSKKPRRYYWLPMAKNKSKKTVLNVIKDYFGVSAREAKMYNISNDELLEMVVVCGWQKDEISKLKEDLEK